MGQERLQGAETPEGDPRRLEKYRPTPWLVQRLYRPYVRWALVVALTLGFSTGTAMFWLPALGVPVGQAWVTHTQPTESPSFSVGPA